MQDRLRRISKVLLTFCRVWVVLLVIGIPGSALAADQPSAGSVGLQEASATKALLRASTFSAGISTATVYFEYGTTTSYGAVSQTFKAPANSSYSSCLFPLVGLSPGTLYHYRIRASNGQGNVVGVDQTFTTAALPVIITRPCSGITDISALFPARYNTAGVPSTITFEYGTTISYGSTQPPSQSPFYLSSLDLTEVAGWATQLLPSTTYHYRAKLENVDGVYYGSDVTFTTSAAATLPAVMDYASFDFLGATRVQLSSGKFTTGGSTASLAMEYGETTSYGSQVPCTASFPPNVASYGSVVLSGITPGTTYHFRTKVTNGQGVAYGPDGTFTTPLSGTPPTAPSVSQYNKNVHADTATFSIRSLRGGSAPAIASIECGLDTSYGINSATSLIPVGMTASPTFTLLNLLPGTTYHYRAKITSTEGTAYGEDGQFTTSSISYMANTDSASDITTTTARLSGTFNATVIGGKLSFEYGTDLTYGSTISGSPDTFSTFSGPASSSAQLSGLNPNTTYHYRAVLTDSKDTAHGEDKTFTTVPASSPLVITGAGLGNMVTLSPNTAMGILTVEGTVTTRGLPATVFVEYGLDPALNQIQAVPSGSVPANSTLPINVTLRWLEFNRTYYYRLVTSDSQGLTYGALRTCTVGPPTIFRSARVLHVRGSSVTIQVDAQIPLNDYYSSTTYIEYGLTTSYGTIAQGVGSIFTLGRWSSVSLTSLSLEPETTYHYRVVILTPTGTVCSPDMTFTTNQDDMVIDSFTAQSVTDTTALLTLTANPNNRSEEIIVAYGESADGIYSEFPLSPAITLPGGQTVAIATLTGLKPGTTYFFRAKSSWLDAFGFPGADFKSSSGWKFTTLTRAENWRKMHFGTTADAGDAADDAMPRHDGISNLMKYALGMDPTLPATPLPQLEILFGRLRYRFPRDPAKNDITYFAESADSPGGPWQVIATSALGAVTTGPGFVSETPQPVGTRLVEVADPGSIESTPHRFIRLRVKR